MTASPNAATWQNLASIMVLEPGAPAEVFWNTAEKVGRAMLKVGHEPEFILSELQVLGRVYSDLRARIAVAPEVSARTQ